MSVEFRAPDLECRASAEDPLHELIRARIRLEEQAAQIHDLQAALGRKTALLHEADHRIKNNLQIVSSLVLLKARRINDEKGQRILHNLAERIGALAMVHRLLHSIGDVGRLDLAVFLGELMGELATLLPSGRIRTDLRIEPIAVSATKAAPLALLLNELMSNAVTHAYPGGRQGQLLVSATKLGSDLHIAVEDDGIGLDGSAPPGEGFGRILADMLVRQLKGQIAWLNASPGTRVIVILPLDDEEAWL